MHRRFTYLLATLVALSFALGLTAVAGADPGNGQGQNHSKGIGVTIAPGQSVALSYTDPSTNDVYSITETSKAITQAQANAVAEASGTQPASLNSRRLQSARRAASSGCWEGTETIEDYSLGIFQDKWAHIVDWCGNGSSVTSFTRNIGQNFSTGTLWSYVASNAWGNRYTSTIDAFAQGHYCYIANLGCPQSNWPTHRGNFNGDGTWSTTYLQLK